MSVELHEDAVDLGWAGGGEEEHHLLVHQPYHIHRLAWLQAAVR